MNIFGTLKVGTHYFIEKEMSFSQECIDSVSKAEVVDSTYGQSVCFFMHSGDKKYLPITGGTYPEGMKVNMNTSTVCIVGNDVTDNKLLRVKIR